MSSKSTKTKESSTRYTRFDDPKLLEVVKSILESDEYSDIQKIAVVKETLCIAVCNAALYPEKCLSNANDLMLVEDIRWIYDVLRKRNDLRGYSTANTIDCALYHQASEAAVENDYYETLMLATLTHFMLKYSIRQRKSQD